MHTKHKHTPSAWRNTHTSPYTSTYSSTRHNTNKNTTSITSLTQTYSILQHSKAKTSSIFNYGRYRTHIPTDPHTVPTTDIQTNMSHIHTSIVFRHLVTRGNHKILHTLHHTLAALKRYFPASLVAPLPNSEQINHPSSNHTYTNLTPTHIHHQYVRPLCNTYIHNTHHLHTHHIVRNPAGVTVLLARWTEKLAGGPHAGRSDCPTRKGQGSG